MYDITVAITSKSFSNNTHLRKMAQNEFARVSFYKSDIVTQSDLTGFLQGCDAAIVGLDPITREMLDVLPCLKAISKYGVGLDNIDIGALKERGVYLGWKPGTNARSVAELTLCFMLGMIRNVFRSGLLLKKMQWKKNGGYQLSEKTIGIIGCGNVGKDLVRLLKPFSCRILVNDIVSYEEFYNEMGVEPVSLTELLKQSDIVTLHVPLDNSTHYMIRTETLKMMKKTAYLINTSRGGVVKTEDLKTALIEGWISAAAIDVFEIEPPTDNDFLNLENLYVTPHIGGNAEEAVRAMGEAAINNLVEYFSNVRSETSRKEGTV